MTEKEKFLETYDYQMKKMELIKESLFFQKYSIGYEKEKDIEEKEEKEKE